MHSSSSNDVDQPHEWENETAPIATPDHICRCKVPLPMLQDVVVVKGERSLGGGGIWASQFALVVMPGLVDGKRFAEVYAGNKYCMNRVDQLVKLRNAMVGELIVDEEEKTGEYDETSMAGQAEAYELLPPNITISVPRDGDSMVDKVKVLKSWFESDVIRIELTPANVEMLHEKPPKPAESAPSSNEEDVEQPHHAEELATSLQKKWSRWSLMQSN